MVFRICHHQNSHQGLIESLGMVIDNLNGKLAEVSQRPLRFDRVKKFGKK